MSKLLTFKKQTPTSIKVAIGVAIGICLIGAVVGYVLWSRHQTEARIETAKNTDFSFMSKDEAESKSKEIWGKSLEDFRDFDTGKKSLQSFGEFRAVGDALSRNDQGGSAVKYYQKADELVGSSQLTDAEKLVFYRNYFITAVDARDEKAAREAGEIVKREIDKQDMPDEDKQTQREDIDILLSMSFSEDGE